MNKNFLKYYIAIAYFFSTVVLFAQPGDDSTGDPIEGPDAPAPIDNYLLILAFIGLVYVFLRIRAFQNKKIQG